ncbi:RNA 3'-terminal phosphate cyclase [Candidatus Thorarchaeota archaeon]|nr:MAG: RNA 3'-terminal phosphate cyclase [Candidatus Thorarchaeota archaeon]
MIEIDGSHGEGGGQILRTSISLAALTMNSIRITSIRAGRPKPGLKKQHLAGIKLAGKLVNAEIKGAQVGSKEVEFVPKKRTHGQFTQDVGTAGSLSLLLQAVLPPAVLSPNPVQFNLKGGTDVAWSPPMDYMNHVFAWVLEKMGPRTHFDVEQRGHYPRGGGEVIATIEPVEHIKPLDMIEFGELKHIRGISHCVRLPNHVAKRQAKAAKETLEKQGIENIDIEIETYSKKKDPHLGAGSGIVLWAESRDGCRLGADSLGKRGKRAERVGEEAAQRLLEEILAGMAVDMHLADMLVPYFAIAEGTSRIGVSEISSHLKTNIWVAEQILGVENKIETKPDGTGVISIKGVGITLLD